MSHYTSFVRILALAVRQHIWPLPRIGVFDVDTLAMCVWPNAIDFNLHMNNARYLSVMDYGRMHLLARAGSLEHILRSRWQPLVGGVWVTYRRSLPLFARFTLASRLVCWDSRWFYIEQTFTGRDGIAAVGWVKGMLRDARGTLDPNEVITRVAPAVVRPPLPEAMLAWNELTREVLQSSNI